MADRDRSPVRSQPESHYDVELAWRNSSLFMSWISLLNAALGEDVELTFHPELGVSVGAMDSSHVSWVSTNLLPKSFSYYRLKNNQPCNFCVDLNIFAGIMSRIQATDSVEFRYAASTDKVELHVVRPGVDKKKLLEDTSDWTLNTIFKEYELNEPPDIVWPASVALPSTHFFLLVKQVQDVGDVVDITIDESGLALKADGDLGSLRKHIGLFSSTNAVQLHALECPPNSSTTVPMALKFLMRLVRLNELTEEILLKLYFTEKSPAISLVATFHGNVGQFSWWCAGQIKD